MTADREWQLVNGKWRSLPTGTGATLDAMTAGDHQAATLRSIEERAIAKAIDAVSGAVVMDGEVRKSGAQTQLMSRTPGSWSSFGAAGSQLMARVGTNLATAFNRPPADLEARMAAQGMSWGPPFPPGRPLDPFFGYRRAPRTFDYSIGVNTQVTPRWGRVSFQTLKALWEAYDVAQICTRHLINDVRTLDHHFEAAIGVREDVSDDIIKARQFFDSPDKRQPFSSWIAEYLMDVIRYDAGCLYVRRNEGGDPIALEVVSGSTIIPNLDYYGRVATDEDDDDPKLTAAGTFRGEEVPAYVQIIEGMPWDWLAADDLIYQPINPLPDSQYGLAPLEAVMLTANTDLRFQWHFLQYFTAGSIPSGFMEAPPDLSDPAQIAEWQGNWDALMIGDQAKLRQIRWVPNGAKFQPVGAGAAEFDDNFPLYLMRRTCAAHGVTPNDLGFTDTVNKATSETMVDVQFRVGTMPYVRHLEGVINLFLQEALHLQVRLRFDTGREIEDRLATAQAEGVYIDHGVLSADEPRTRLGYPIALNRPTPRFINNARNGPVPLISLESLSGKTDPETFGPAKDAPLIDHPFVPVPGVMPPIGSQDAKNADNTQAAMQANMIAAASGQPPPFPDDASTSPPPRKPTVTPPATPGGSVDDNPPALKAALNVIDHLLDRLGVEKDGPTAGLTVSTGMQGADLVGDDDEDDDEDDVAKAESVALQLRQWRENSRNRLRKGLPPRKFVSADLPDEISSAIWRDLSAATTRDEIDRAFLGKARARPEPGDADTEAVRAALTATLPAATLRHAIRAARRAARNGAVKGEITAAGIAVVARDTGRVLLIQRDNDDPEKQASGKFEWPGGRLDPDEDAWDAALREWQEETGNTLPKGRRADSWTQGDYRGFVYVIPSEKSITLNPDREAREVKDPDHPQVKQGEVMAWWDPKDAKHSDHALRDEFDDFDWGIIKDALDAPSEA